MESRPLWTSLIVLLLMAAPALAVEINPSTTDTVENAKVQLNASVQGNDSGCNYSWSQTLGPTALNQTNGNGGTKHWEFTTPSVNVSTKLEFTVKVENCTTTSKNGTATATVNVIKNVSNKPPVASATVLSPDPTAIFEGSTVTLDGSASSDPDNDPLTYLWEQVDGPTVTLSSATTVQPTFIAPNNASSVSGSTLQFKLTVSDGALSNSTTLTVNVRWVNDPPKAVLSCPENVDERADLNLDGSGSTDTDDGIATYYWSQTYGGPTFAGLPTSGTSSISLVAPTLTSAFKKVTLGLKVTDNSGDYDTTTCDVTVNDITPPVFSDVPADITAEATSPAGAEVTFTAPTAIDAVDGTRDVNCQPASGSMFALGDTTVTCSATDESGNDSSATFLVTVEDTTPPTISGYENISAFATSGSGNVVTYPNITASDLVDGSVPVTCTPPSGSIFLGTKTVECTATDAHNNTATITFTVSVLYNWAGFFQPVDNYPVMNVVKAGSAVPIKFNLGGNLGLNIFSAGYPRAMAIVGDSLSESDISETVTPGGSSLTYDGLANQYIYVWKTEKSWAGTSKQLQLKLADGTTHVANFKFK